ncbi:arginase family protein [Actinoplanes sp. NPDC051633]|uniref:arginase family protein n=1 Tax=Actinoplanes sp. NPDC051633 TaxID=3155670 RepID=UPI00344A4877
MIIVPFHQDQRLPGDHLPVEGEVIAPELPPGDIWTKLAALDEAVATRVAAAEVPATVISGDCLVSMGVLAGVQRTGVDPAVIWFDAHGDVHTLETTTSGYLGGLSLRLLMGAHSELLADRLGVRPVAEDRCVLVDARDLDPAEADFLKGSAVQQSSVGDLRELPDGPLLLHVDLDVIDPSDLPGLLFPAPDGPPASRVLAAIHRVIDTGRVVALDIACPWHPADPENQRRRSGLLTALLGN